MIFWGIKKNLLWGKQRVRFKPPVFSCFIVLIVSMLSLLFYFRFSRAASFSLYPENCLGSWQNPQLAQGQPDAADTSAIDGNNSAVFSEGGVKEIYCGSFSGDLSGNEIKLVKSVTLKFSWLISDEELKMDSTSSPLTATSSITIIQSPATSSEAVAQNTNDVVNQILNNVHADEVKLIISTTTPEITVITNTVSQATTSDTQISPTSDVGTTSETENTAAIAPVSGINATSTGSNPDTVTATSSPTSFWWKKYNFFYADDQVNNVQQEAPISEVISAATSSLDSPLSPTEDFLKVSYTIDGINWQALGTVNKNNWQNTNFQIPVYQLEDVKKIQIKIESLPILNKTPFVYLDGMALEVEYETAQTSKAKVTHILSKLSNSSSGNSVSFNLTFSWEDKLKDLGCNGEEDKFWGVAISADDSRDIYISNIPISERNGIIKADIPANHYQQIEMVCSSEAINLFVANDPRGGNPKNLTGGGVMIEEQN